MAKFSRDTWYNIGLKNVTLLHVLCESIVIIEPSVDSRGVNTYSGTIEVIQGYTYYALT